MAIASHFGRPQPRKQTWAEMQASHSLGVVASAIAARLGIERFTGLAPDCIGPLAVAKVEALQPGQVGRLFMYCGYFCPPCVRWNGGIPWESCQHEGTLGMLFPLGHP